MVFNVSGHDAFKLMKIIYQFYRALLAIVLRIPSLKINQRLSDNSHPISSTFPQVFYPGSQPLHHIHSYLFHRFSVLNELKKIIINHLSGSKL